MNQQVAVVFGATGQIGSRICTLLAQNHIAVVVHCFSNTRKAEAITSAIRESGGTAMAAQADIRDLDCVQELLANVYKAYGRIDIAINLIHKDSDFKPIPIADMEWQDWSGHLDALKAHFNICKAVLPYMKAQHYGRILYLSGGLAYRFYKGSAAFSTVKAGLNAFCKTLALEVGADNITVNIISPGRVVEKNEVQASGEFADDCVSKCPMGRFASPDDIAHAVLFFISPGAEIITGQTLYITGGEIMPMP